MMIVKSVQDNIQPPRAPTEPFQIADDIRLKPMHLAADRLDERWLGIIIVLVHNKPFVQNSYSLAWRGLGLRPSAATKKFLL